MDKDLLNYIRGARALDFNDEKIKISLTQVGWDEDHIIKALSEANKPQPKTSTETNHKKEEIKPSATNKIIFIILIIILIFALFVAGYGIYRNFLIK